MSRFLSISARALPAHPHAGLRLSSSLPSSSTALRGLLAVGLVGLGLLSCSLRGVQAETRPGLMQSRKRQARQKPSAPFRPFALERSSRTDRSEALYLRQGNARTLLSGWEEKAVPRAGSWKLIPTPATDDKDRSVRVLKGGKVVARLSLERVRDTFLENDAFWASDNTDYTGKTVDPHKTANQMRYMHQSAGRVGVFLSDVFPTAAGWLAVLNWKLYGPSGEPIGAQHLVFLPASSTPSIEPVRLLDASLGTTSAVQKRLFASINKTDKGVKLLLWEQRQAQTEGKAQAWSELTEVGSHGERRRSFMRLPTYAHPYDRMGEMWLVCTNAEGGAAGNRVDVVDLRAKTVSSLLVEPPVERGSRSVSILGVDAATDSVLFSRETYTEGSDSSSRLFLLSVPGGKQRLLPRAWAGQVIFLWRGHLFLDSTRGAGNEAGAAERAYKVYDARTLKLVQHLSLSR